MIINKAFKESRTTMTFAFKNPLKPKDRTNYLNYYFYYLSNWQEFFERFKEFS